VAILAERNLGLRRDRGTPAKVTLVKLVEHHEFVPSENCRVCGYLYEEEDASALPWGGDGENPTFAFCIFCGVEFGYQDATPEGARVGGGEVRPPRRRRTSCESP
jgi:hypothetical protein